VLANELAELNRRINREPGEVEHWRGKAGLLMALGRVPETREVVVAAQSALPGSYWPRMALAALDIGIPTVEPEKTKSGSKEVTPSTTQAAKLPASVTAFSDWVGGQPSLTRYYYLSVLYRLANQEDPAAQAMAQAVAQPLEISADDPNIGAYYMWDMARWALARKRWELAVQICDAWGAAAKDHHVVEESYRPIRAAAELAMGAVASAQTDLAAIGEKPLWAKNLDGPDGLREAVAKGDRGFRYKPGDSPREFRVFPVPE
jgi:hypothetical protein